MPNSLQPHGLYSQWHSPAQNTGLGSLSLLQGIFPKQGLNPDLPHCRQILYQLSNKGTPRILEWTAYPFSQGIFPTQELNQGLLRCRWILYQLSCQGSPNLFKRHILIVSHILCLAMGTLIQTLSLGCLESYGNDYIRFLVKGFVVWFYVKYSNFTSRKLG